MANLRNIQFLRNAQIYASLEAAKTGLASQAANELDGSPLIGRYLAGEEERSILGLVHVSGSTTGVTFFMNEKEFDNILDGLDYGPIGGTDASVLTQIQQSDGKISGLTANVGSLKLTDYIKGSDSGNVAATDTINAAVSKLENQIDAEEAARIAAIEALDYTGYTLGESEVFATITENDGIIAATGKNLSGIKLNGLTAGTDSKIAATDTLGEALANIQAQIDAMDKDASAVDGQVVTTVTETDGKVTETKANVKDLQLGGYVKGNNTGDIASADTINVALSKLENKAAAITIANADGSINVTTGATGTDINVNIKSGDYFLAKDGGNGVYSNIAISSVTGTELSDLGTNVQEAYKLVGLDGSTVRGEYIKIYKDSSLVNFYLGTVEDLLSGTTAQTEESSSSTVVPGPSSADTALVYVMQLADGNYKLTAVNVQSFLEESEFASGVTANANHVVHGVVDPNSESFFTVGADGFKVAGISGFVQSEIEKLDADKSGSTTHVGVRVEEVDGKITVVTVSEDDIASAQGLADEITARTAADTELSNRIGTGVTTANTATAQLIALSGNSSSTSAETSVEGAKRYAEAIAGELNSDLSGSSTHMTVGVKEESGVITAVTVSESDVANASDLATLSGKTYTVSTSSNNSITLTESTADDGTTSIDVITDASKISGLTAVSDVAGEISGVTASDSVQTGIKNLYASLAAEIAARKAAISSTTINGSYAIDVARSESGDTVSLKLDDSTQGTGSENTNGVNALTITNDGLFLSTNWDCGTFNDGQ